MSDTKKKVKRGSKNKGASPPKGITPQTNGGPENKSSNPLISHKDDKGRPVGKGGETRRKKIMDYVDDNS
jgi:hypothetical protein